MPVFPHRTASFLRVSARDGGAAFCLLVLPWLAWSGHAHAEEKSVVAAANAYAQGQQAELKGDLDRAAELFELADRIAPTPEALRSATRARLGAGQMALAADDAEALLARYRTDPASRELGEQVLATARPQLTRYTFECSAACTVVVDQIATAVTPAETQVVYVVPGPHDVELGFGDDNVQSLELTGGAGEERTVKVARPAAPAKPAPVARSVAPRVNAIERRPLGKPGRLSPVYFWTAASLAVVAGGLTAWSGLDLLNARDDFKSNPTRSKFDEGESKDARTSALIGVTSVLAVSTATLALFTRFRSEEKRAQAAVSFDGHGAQLKLRGSF
jgi:hypothetical protein